MHVVSDVCSCHGDMGLQGCFKEVYPSLKLLREIKLSLVVSPQVALHSIHFHRDAWHVQKKSWSHMYLQEHVSLSIDRWRCIFTINLAVTHMQQRFPTPLGDTCVSKVCKSTPCFRLICSAVHMNRDKLLTKEPFLFRDIKPPSNIFVTICTTHDEYRNREVRIYLNSRFQGSRKRSWSLIDQHMTFWE